MDDEEIFAGTYGINDIPEDQRDAFDKHMFARACMRAYGQERFYPFDVREFFAKIRQECPPPGRKR